MNTEVESKERNKMSVSLSLHRLHVRCFSFHHYNSFPPLIQRSTTLKTSKAPLRIAASSNSHETRRSANYKPNTWDYDLLESLPTNNYEMRKRYREEREKMIAEVKGVLSDPSMDSLRRLELVDAVDRLGLERHFREEIKACIGYQYSHDMKAVETGDLHTTAVRFRVLRQHGYLISEDVFNKFIDQSGNIYNVFIEDTNGLLSLYEASFLESRRDENLVKIRGFVAQRLKARLGCFPPKLAQEVKKALELPLHWRFPRLKACWSFDKYDHNNILHPSLIALAKLDYNILQDCYKNEIKLVVRWWKKLELVKKLPYSRDRLMEHYLWTVGIIEDPEYHIYRVMETKLITLLSALDDTYDIYGTLEELELLTHFIDRWEINGIDRLPTPMRHCFLAIYETSNEISDFIFKEKGFHIISYLSKSWARLSKHYLKEAKWFNVGYKPSLLEYLETSIVSIGAHLMLLDCHLLTTPSISDEAIQYIDNLPNLLRCAATTIRLSNDLATSKDELTRGDTLKAVECYMNENGVCEEVAREYIKSLIMETMKKMNEEYYLQCPQYPVTISEPFLGATFNLARSSQYYYSSKKNWHDKPEQEMMDQMMSLFINPIV